MGMEKLGIDLEKSNFTRKNKNTQDGIIMYVGSHLFEGREQCYG